MDKLLKERDTLKTNNYDSEIYKEPLKSEESTLTVNSDLKRSLSSPNLAQVKKIKLTKDVNIIQCFHSIIRVSLFKNIRIKIFTIFIFIFDIFL